MCINKFTSCCDQCLNYLGHISIPAAKVWHELCYTIETNDLLGGFLIYSPRYSRVIRILEINGFIVTTDSKECNFIKLKGIRFDENNELIFCVRAGDHE
jgi:hypothetical protein